MNASTKDFLKELASYSKRIDAWVLEVKRECTLNAAAIDKYAAAHPKAFAAQSNPYAALRDIAKFYVD